MGGEEEEEGSKKGRRKKTPALSAEGHRHGEHGHNGAMASKRQSSGRKGGGSCMCTKVHPVQFMQYMSAQIQGVTGSTANAARRTATHEINFFLR